VTSTRFIDNFADYTSSTSTYDTEFSQSKTDSFAAKGETDAAADHPGECHQSDGASDCHLRPHVVIVVGT
jgi:hypothetical protein